MSSEKNLCVDLLEEEGINYDLKAVRIDESNLSQGILSLEGFNACDYMIPCVTSIRPSSISVTRVGSLRCSTTDGVSVYKDLDSETTLAKLAKELITAIRCNIETIEPNPEGTDWNSVVNIQYISEELEMLEKLIKDNKYNV